jgi:hypothetical protein
VYVDQILAASREYANTKCSRGFRKGDNRFVVESLEVLEEWGKEHMKTSTGNRDLVDAYAVARFKQARKLIWTGDRISGLRSLLGACCISPSATIRYCAGCLRDRMRRTCF